MYKHYGVVNKISHTQVMFYSGGIHERVFGMDNIFLTKHPLVKCVKGLDPCPHAHFVSGAFIADICLVLMHYLFIEGFVKKAARIAANKNYRYSQKYVNYSDTLAGKQNLLLVQDDSEKYRGVEQLIEKGFVFVSHEFKKWVQLECHGGHT